MVGRGRAEEIGVEALASELDYGRFEGCADGGVGTPSNLTIISLYPGGY